MKNLTAIQLTIRGPANIRIPAYDIHICPKVGAGPCACPLDLCVGAKPGEVTCKQQDEDMVVNPVSSSN